MSKLIDRVMNVAMIQYQMMDDELQLKAFPRSVDADGKLVTSDIYWWCSGFYPGTLWYLYEYSSDINIKHLAQNYTELLDSIQYVKTDHDVGFQLNCSYGNGFRLTRDPAYRKVLICGAKSLSTRFNPVVGCIKSWDNEKWSYPVIIDNMMNLELLMFAATELNNDTLSSIACKHANTTIKNHFRADFSTFHLVDYSLKDGSVIKKQTVQGLRDNSSWSRGQAWGLYGYTMMFRTTGTLQYLDQAENIANYLINHPNLPEDGIPYWDFSTKKKDDLRDASAGAIMASALIELSVFTKSEKLSKQYLRMAEKQLRTLASEVYLAKVGENNHFLLKHSVGNMPGKQEVDEPLSYGDYYFVEALMRYKKVVLKNK